MTTIRRDRSAPSSIFDVLAELAAVGFTLAVAYGFVRLFDDLSFFSTVALVAVMSHLFVMAARWLKAGLIISAFVSVVGFAATIWLVLPPTPSGQPDSSILQDYGTELGAAWDQFQTVSAPAEITEPFLLIVSIVMWMVPFLSDWAAFRLRSAAESLIPGFAVFVFGAFFAADQQRLLSTAVVVLAALLAILFHRTSEAEYEGTWLDQASIRKGQASLTKVGVGVLALTLLAGVSVAQALPGYEEPPIDNFDPTTWNDPVDPRVVVSPLVDIQSRLIDQPDVEVFRVQSPTRDYWRLTSLDVFDGSIWRSRGSFEGAEGGLDSDLPNGTTIQTIEQNYEISALAQIWLPAAYEPTQISNLPDDIEIEYEAESGTLIVNRETQNSDGLSYTLMSQVPLRDEAGVEAIRTAGSNVPSDIAERYLSLPDGFSPRVIDLAQQVVSSAGATTPYDQALALQNYFRDPVLFSYSLEVQSGHGNSEIEDFLFENHTGYCEQFAGSFAAMARAVGLPSRVAVGFTPGELDTTTGTYVVTGKHAHAWPEVWLDGVGWLRFEPTPGRGAPGDESYTGVPEDQEGPAPTPNGEDDTGADSGSGVVPPTTVNPNQPGPSTTTIPEFGPGNDPADVTTEVIGGTQAGPIATILQWLAALAAIALVVFSPLLYGQWRASRRRSATGNDPRRIVGLAWDDSKTAVKLLGVPVAGSDTAREVATKVSLLEAPRAEGAAQSLRSLASTIDQAAYSGAELTRESAVAAEQISVELAAMARSNYTTRGWWLHHMNPLNVWRERVGAWGHLRAKASDYDRAS